MKLSLLQCNVASKTVAEPGFDLTGVMTLSAGDKGGGAVEMWFKK